MMQKTIYIVDSNKQKSKEAHDLLKLDYKILEADNVEDAIANLKDNPADLFICDISTAKGKEFEIITKLRAHTDAPVIVYTCLSSIKDKINCYTLGCDDYLVYPCDVVELSLRVNACLKRVSKVKDILIEFAPLTMNLKTRDVMVGEQYIRLTNREFEILNYLSETPNKVVTIQDIYKRVWGNETPCDNHIVMVNISYLRKKIEKALPGKDFIRTCWGTGYSFAYPPVNTKN